MIARVGHILQYIALLLLPFGLGAGMLANNIDLELKMLWIGGALFVLGWLMTKKTA